MAGNFPKMDELETREFLRDAARGLPRLKGYLAETGDAGKMVLRAWARGLAEIDAKDATEVMIQIAANEAPLPDGFMWENFPGLVRDRVKHLRYAMSKEARIEAANNRESTYACALCLDTGFVKIYHPGFVRSYVLYSSCRTRLAEYDPDSREDLRGEFEAWRAVAIEKGAKGSILSFTFTALCTCHEGDRHAEQPKDPNSRKQDLSDVIRYDANRTAVFRCGTPREVLQWLAKRNEPVEWNADDWN